MKIEYIELNTSCTEYSRKKSSQYAMQCIYIAIHIAMHSAYKIDCDTRSAHANEVCNIKDAHPVFLTSATLQHST